MTQHELRAFTLHTELTHARKFLVAVCLAVNQVVKYGPLEAVLVWRDCRMMLTDVDEQLERLKRVRRGE